MASFGESVRMTKCPYAGLTEWRQIAVEYSLIDQHGAKTLENVGGAIRELIVADGDLGVDMLAIELDHPSLIGDLEAFTRAAAHFVRGLLGWQGIPDQSDGLADGVDEWIAYVNDERLFIFTLCPFYGETHPRRCGTGSAFIVIQFVRSFRKINMHRMTLAEKKQLSNKVKSIFTKAGIDYFAYITQDSPEALKLVKPLKQGDLPVRWWRTL